MERSSLDVVVGVCTKNCADTVASVLKTVDSGLERFFSAKRSLIVVSDGFSTDDTQEAAHAVETAAEKVVTPQTGGPGKGNGVRTILEIAQKRRAAAVALVDGDLTSIAPTWVQWLIGPIFAGNDLVVPYYLRHRYDGVITNQLAFPLTNVLLGLGVRQPIGGEYGLSQQLVERLLGHPLFPKDFGIDIFITLAGTAEGAKIVEAVLGIKEHESTKQYADPDKLLVPMFYQVVGTLFHLIRFYRGYIRSVRGIRPVKRLGTMPTSRPAPLAIDQHTLYQRFKTGYEKIITQDISYLETIREELDHIAASPFERFSFPLELWVKSVYHVINAFTASEEIAVLDTLRVLWQGRFLSLVKETRLMTDEEAEATIKQQIDVFWRYRAMLDL